MRTAPGRFWYAVAALLAVAGAALCAALLLKFVGGLTDTRQFLMPGRLVFAADAPGRFVLWHDYRTVFAGRNYVVPEALPDGARISIIELASGRSLEVRASSGMRSTTDSAERLAVAVFRIADAGRYEAAVEGDFAPRVMSVGPSLFPRVLLELGGAIASLLLGLGGGGALAAWA